MISNEIERLSGVISPRQPAEKIQDAWAFELQLNGLPDTPLWTDGEKFTIDHRPIWPEEGVKQAFLLVVQKVHNLEAQRVGLPHPSLGATSGKEDLQIAWDRPE